MKFLLIALALFVHTAVISRYYYISGINDARFDRQRANAKLQQCSNILAGIK